MSTLNEVLAEQDAKRKASESNNSNQVDSASKEPIDYEKEFYQALVFGTKASNPFPSADEDLEYFQSIPEYTAKIDDFKNRITGLVEQFTTQVGIVSDDDLDAGLQKLKEGDAGDERNFEPISDVVDLLLENIDSYLEQAKGSNRESDTASKVSNNDLARRVQQGLHGVVTHANIQRPQLSFQDTIDNSRINRTFKLGVVSSANENKQQQSVAELHARSMGVDVDLLVQESQNTNPHPLMREIQLSWKQPSHSWMHQSGDPSTIEKYTELENDKFTWIGQPEQLERLCDLLEKETKIAVDLENHSYRSFQGFLCLMQISTTEKDYLVDTLALRSCMHTMSRVFTNPSILKVFHGADSDILWLQRDFGLYVVSMFDTGQAARVLEYPSAGLAYCLRHHCGVNVNKAYQLADWRIRPLPEEMSKYAREDTHYLLYIFEHMRYQLLSKSEDVSSNNYNGGNLVNVVLERSANICQTVYQCPIYTPQAYQKIIQRRNLRLSVNQERVLSATYEWRDRIARVEDESEEYVIPQRLLIRIAEAMPTSVNSLEACCSPMPPVLRVRQIEFLSVIKAAVSSVLAPPELAASLANASSGQEQTDKMDIDVKTLLPEKVINKKTVVTVPTSSMTVPTTMVSSSASIGGQTSCMIGINASRSSFVPISQDFHTKQPLVLHRHPANSSTNTVKHSTTASTPLSRATPSPVLTTDQLYAAAGWQDLQQESSTLRRKLIQQQSSPGKGKNEVGRMGQLLSFTPTRKLHPPPSAISRNPQSSSAESANFMRSNPKNATSPSALGKTPTTTTKTSLQAEDRNEMADTEALEGDDIPKSIAEIYRISNGNRKRNKEKKKNKEDHHSSTESSTTSTKGRKNKSLTSFGTDILAAATATNSTIFEDGTTAAATSKKSTEPNTVEMTGDDAVKFMREIGWVGDGGDLATMNHINFTSNMSDKPSHNKHSMSSPKQRAYPSTASGSTKSSRGGRGGGSGFEYSRAAAVSAGVTTAFQHHPSQQQSTFQPPYNRNRPK